jgi:hypothetical protein
VKRYVSATLDLEDLDSLASKEFRRSNEMLLLRGATERDYGRVLNEKEDVLRDCS